MPWTCRSGRSRSGSRPVFSKLGLSAEPDLNRRVAAVLIYLRESASG